MTNATKGLTHAEVSAKGGNATLKKHGKSFYKKNALKRWKNAKSSK